MIIRCKEDSKEILLSYLKDEAMFNTFMVADIVNFGFDKEFQTIYADVEDDECKGVYLKFYENLIVYTKEKNIDKEVISAVLGSWKPQVIMGKLENINAIESHLAEYKLNSRPFYSLGTLENNENSNYEIIKGKPGDEDKIHDFLMSIDEMKILYASKEMIKDRLIIGDGNHYYIEKNGEIIAHGNSAAKGPYTAMVGGVATKIEERGKGLATEIAKRVIVDLLEENKESCLFSAQDEKSNLFIKLGFENKGQWGTLERKV